MNHSGGDNKNARKDAKVFDNVFFDLDKYKIYIFHQLEIEKLGWWNRVLCHVFYF